MENYGLVTYYEDGLYFTNWTTSATYQGAINVNAHELAHMLWGDLFTPLWWSDTWTKEGSATFWRYPQTHTHTHTHTLGQSLTQYCCFGGDASRMI